MRSLRWTFASLVTAMFGSGVAYFLSLVLISPAHSQTKGAAPSDGSLPAEYAQQIEAQQASQNPSPHGSAEKPSASADPNLPLPNNDAKPMESPPPAPQGPPPTKAPPPLPSTSQGPAEVSSAPHPTASISGTAVGGEEYVYDPAGRRDPFKPYKVIRVQSPQAKNIGKSDDSLEPLQRFDIDQLTVLAILWDVKQPRALVRDSEGKVHTLVKSTKLGRNNGYVATIREGEVVVMETIDDESGKAVKRVRTLEFKKKERD